MVRFIGMTLLALATVGCRREVAVDEIGTTEYWLSPAMGLAIRFEPSAELTVSSTISRLRLSGRRWGDPSITFRRHEDTGAIAHAEKRSFANGAVVEYTGQRVDDERTSKGTLRGLLRFNGRAWDIECVEFKESESGANPEWCLNYFATIRDVPEKP